MAEYDVFLCHATVDKPAVRTLATKLEEHEIKCFLDEWNLIPGDPIQPALQSALLNSTCCAVFIGPDTTGPWQNREIQSALRKQVNESRYRVIPVQLPGGPALDKLGDDLSFLSDNLGVIFKDGLDDETALARLLCGIRNQAPGTVVDQNPHDKAGPNAEGELSIHLRLTDQGLSRRYFDRHGDEITIAMEPENLPMPSSSSAITDDDLYRLLFHKDAEDLWPKIRDQIIGNGATGNPSRFPLRLRLHIDHSTLAALPWSRLRYRDLALEDWVVELTDEDEPGYWPTANLTLDQHCPVLLIAPDQQAFHCDAHAEALLWHFQEIWSKQNHLHIASGVQEIKDTLQQARPGIVYFFGRANDGPHGLTLQSESGETLATLEQMARTWRRPPQIVFLNLLIDSTQGESVIWSARRLLEAQVPLTIVQYGHHGSDEAVRAAHHSALNWFEALLTDERQINPVKLLHRHGLPTAAAWSDCGSWIIDFHHPQRQATRDKLARLMLDREDQRKDALDILLKMMGHQKRKMTCLLCYGGPSDMGGWFGRQIQTHIRRQLPGQLDIKIQRCALPPGDGFTVEQVRNAFFESLKANADSDLKKLLAAPKKKLPGQRRLVLMLDWQVRALDKPQQGLTTNALRNWLSFCAETLASACPDGTRLLGCLVVEGPSDRQEKLQNVFKQLQQEYNNDRMPFYLERLNPLHRVDEEHIMKYLVDVECPRELRDSLSALILKEAGGDFEDTVALLDGQRIQKGWPGFERWLREQQGHGTQTEPPATDNNLDDEPL